MRLPPHHDITTCAGLFSEEEGIECNVPVVAIGKKARTEADSANAVDAASTADTLVGWRDY